MSADAVRIAIHLQRELSDPIFLKVVGDGKTITHVAKLDSAADFHVVKPYLAEAYGLTVSAANGKRVRA